MAFSSTDLDTINSAIASGTMRVRFADGREVTYHSVADLIRARDLIVGELAAAAGTSTPRFTLAGFRKG